MVHHNNYDIYSSERSATNDSRQEEVIRLLATEISEYISVREFLPHFQKKGKLISDGDRHELMRLEGNSTNQGAKLATILISLSKGEHSLLPSLLLGLMDCCEKFHGGKSSYHHWTFVGMLLDTGKLHGCSCSKVTCFVCNNY